MLAHEFIGGLVQYPRHLPLVLRDLTKLNSETSSSNLTPISGLEVEGWSFYLLIHEDRDSWNHPDFILTVNDLLLIINQLTIRNSFDFKIKDISGGLRFPFAFKPTNFLLAKKKTKHIFALTPVLSINCY